MEAIREPGGVARARPDARAALVGVAWLLADQALKHWCATNWEMFERHPILGQEVLVGAKTLNVGLLGNTFSGLPPEALRAITCIVPSAILLALGAAAWLRWSRAHAAERLGFGLVLACGISNLLGNWIGGEVVDPLQISLRGGVALPFNLADLGISVGGAVLLFELLPAIFRSRVPGKMQ